MQRASLQIKLNTSGRRLRRRLIAVDQISKAGSLNLYLQLNLLGNEVDSADLLKHLIDVGKDDTVEVTVLVHGEQIPEASLLHDQSRILNSGEFGDDVGVFRVLLVQRAQDIESLIPI